MKKIFFAVVLWSYSICGIFAAEFMGVNSPDTVKIKDTNLILNGMGLRKKVVFNVYVASLYLENKNKDANTVIKSKENKIVELSFLRSVSGKTIAEAIEESFKKNAPDFNSLKERLNIFKSYIPDLKKKDLVRFIFAKNEILEVYYNGEKKGEIKGSDFCETLLNVWLGEKPADENLKKGMLGL
ncbi:MAG: hypothetical protein GX447_00995 [Elusimicrobia bacterium]|nr:hypothetical protein [Elusimicrobiota bacterium]